ncbi:MAG: T9SS type A sorting domain-containing protein, partial [Bacteroidetes bacterium]|nr:T9SS type A sorting domain-containing protein [Bacteroidota bacterium]
IPVNIINAVLNGADKDNYTLLMGNFPDTTANINKKDLSIVGTFTVFNKEYDGTNTAVINQNNLSLSGFVTGDDVGFSFVAEFSQAEVGTNIPVNIISAVLTGADKDNYTLLMGNLPATVASITTITNIDEIYQNSISVYPNPFTDYIYFNTTYNVSNITLANIIGEKVFEKNVCSKEKIDANALPSGVYILTVQMKNLERRVFKLIKR